MSRLASFGSCETSTHELVRVTRSRSATRQERLGAGWQLAWLGDPRPGVLSLEPAWCVVPAGEFVMGSSPDDHEAHSYERPAHIMRLPAFRIARYPVTNGQWWLFLEGSNKPQPSPQDGHANGPVVGVSWYDAIAYCRWLSAALHYEVRVCTEAEWEKAARGVDGRRYPFGDDLDLDAVHASESDSPAGPAPVGCYPHGASPWGVEDMVGNTYAWTISRWGATPEAPAFTYPYRTDDGREDPVSEDYRVVRGGAWSFPLRNVRCAYRGKDRPSDGFDNLGIRLVSDAQIGSALEKE